MKLEKSRTKSWRILRAAEEFKFCFDDKGEALVLSREVPWSDFCIRSFRQLCALRTGGTTRDGKINQQAVTVVQGD